MELKGVVWLGTRTARFDDMSAFTRDVLGLELKHGEDGLAVFELPDGDTFEIFDTHHPGGGHPDGVAAGFLVDDAEAAATELRAAGVEVTEVGSAGEFRWAYFAASSIEDYAERTEQTVTAWKGMNGQQGGDPAKLADALVYLAGQPEPPLRFAAGAEAVAAFERRANDLLGQANAYRDVSSSLALDSD